MEMMMVFQVLALVGFTALMAALTLLVWEAKCKLAPTLADSKARFDATLDGVNTAVREDVRPAFRRIDTLGAELEQTARPIREGVEAVRGKLQGPLPKAAMLTAPIAAAAPNLWKNVGPVSAPVVAPAGVAVPWQANVSVGLGVATVALQVATLLYLKKRFDALEASMARMQDTLLQEIDAMQRLQFVAVFQPLLAARARMRQVVDLTMGTHTGTVVHAPRQDLLDIVHQLQNGLENLREAAGILDTHQLVARPHIAEQIALEIADAQELARTLSHIDDPEISSKAGTCLARISDVKAAWAKRAAAPLVSGGRASGALKVLQGVDVQAHRQRLKAAFA